jgi:TRAP-type C4-dicarboxylate transport system permease large subunit
MNVVQQLSDATYLEVAKGVMPFILIMACALVLFGVVPQLSTWLPNMMMGK